MKITSLKNFILENNSININNYIVESLNNNLDSDTLKELKELNTLSPEELEDVFSILNYKKDSKEAKEKITKLPKLVIDILNNYGYAKNPEKYYAGLRSLYNRIKVENYVIKKLNDSKDISNVKQVSHDIDRHDNYDLTSSIGNIDVKTHFYGNKNFTITKSEKTKAKWYCFVDMDLSDIGKFNEEFKKAKLYLVNRKEFISNINTQAIGHTELEDKENYHLIKLDTVKKYAKYII